MLKSVFMVDRICLVFEKKLNVEISIFYKVSNRWRKSVKFIALGFCYFVVI